MVYANRELKFIEDADQRKRVYAGRIRNLKKMANQLSVRCGVRIAIVCFGGEKLVMWPKGKDETKIIVGAYETFNSIYPDKNKLNLVGFLRSQIKKKVEELHRKSRNSTNKIWFPCPESEEEKTEVIRSMDSKLAAITEQIKLLISNQSCMEMKAIEKGRGDDEVPDDNEDPELGSFSSWTELEPLRSDFMKTNGGENDTDLDDFKEGDDCLQLFVPQMLNNQNVGFGSNDELMSSNPLLFEQSNENRNYGLYRIFSQTDRKDFSHYDKMNDNHILSQSDVASQNDTVGFGEPHGQTTGFSPYDTGCSTGGSLDVVGNQLVMKNYFRHPYEGRTGYYEQLPVIAGPDQMDAKHVPSQSYLACQNHNAGHGKTSGQIACVNPFLTENSLGGPLNVVDKLVASRNYTQHSYEAPKSYVQPFITDELQVEWNHVHYERDLASQNHNARFGEVDRSMTNFTSSHARSFSGSTLNVVGSQLATEYYFQHPYERCKRF